MEEAFAAGDPPLGLGADAHAAALAWTMPGFAAFDTASVDEDDADTAAPDVPATEASGAALDPAADAEADAVDSAGTTRRGPGGSRISAAADAANAGNRDCRTEPADAVQQRWRRHRGRPDGWCGQAAPTDADPSGDIAGTEGAEAPVPVNGHDGTPDPLDIPEFLRRAPGCSPVH